MDGAVNAGGVGALASIDGGVEGADESGAEGAGGGGVAGGAGGVGVGAAAGTTDAMGRGVGDGAGGALTAGIVTVARSVWGRVMARTAGGDDERTYLRYSCARTLPGSSCSTRVQHSVAGP